jgi:hypothetical protein
VGSNASPTRKATNWIPVLDLAILHRLLAVRRIVV